MAKGNKKDSNHPSAAQIWDAKDDEERKQLYQQYVENMTPKSNGFANALRAFLVGGAICLLGELIRQGFLWGFGDEELAGLYTTISLIALSALFTGLNLYQKMGQFAGAGSIVPITGFANSVVASAIEFSAEGQVFGIGCQIFKIAGPVILYGIFSSWILGILYMIAKTIM